MFLKQLMENKKEELYDLVIGIPTSGNVNWQFASSLMGLQLPGNTRVIWTVRSMIDTARNTIVKEFMKAPGKYLLMVDDDHIFNSDLALRLLARDVDIVGALAFKRRAEYEPCVYKKEEDGSHYPILPEVFQEVDIVGTGAILIKLDVFKKLQFPYFETIYDGICNDCQSDSINPIQGIRCRKCNKYKDVSEMKDIKHWSVDFNFCQKATKAGFKIHVDPQVEIKHIGDPEIVDKSVFLKYHQIIKQ